jgi:drug/metabolite transporter (DMT)-like permease
MISSRVPELALLAVVVVWASTFVLTKQAFTEISPLAFAFVRFGAIAALALAVLGGRVKAGKATWRIRKADIPRFGVAGVCGYCFYQLGFVLGLDRTSPFSSSLLIGTVPLFTIALLAVLGERPALRAWIGVCVALVGAAIFVADRFGAPDSLVGDLLSLGSAISFAAYGIVNRPLVKRYPTATYTAYTVLAGALPLLLISFPAATQQDWRTVSSVSWVVVAYMIVLPVYVAYIVWNWAIARRGAASASSFTLLVPVVSGVFSAFVFGEAFNLEKLLGAALVLMGLVLLQQPTSRVPTMEAREHDEKLRSDAVSPG